MSEERGPRVHHTRPLIVLQHAKARMAQRLNGTGHLEQALTARRCGTPLHEITGEVHNHMLDWSRRDHGQNGVELILYHCAVYVFQALQEADALITVWQIPKPLRHLAAEYDRKRRTQSDGA